MSPRVLVIDDSDALRRSVREVLGTALPDVVVGEAAGARPGLALVGSEPWDAVLLDLSLPDANGLDTLRDIRRLRPELPVVVMSLHPEEEYGPAVRAAGAAVYVTKGSAAETIADAVRGVLRGGSATASAAEPRGAMFEEAGRDSERRQLARVLHDEIGQALVAAKIDLHLAATAAELEEARRRIADAARALDGAIAAVRALTERVRPAGLDELGGGGRGR